MSAKHEVSVYRPVLNLGSDYFEAICELASDCPSPDIQIEHNPKLYLISPDETADLVSYSPALVESKCDALAYWLEMCLPKTAQQTVRIIGGLSIRRCISVSANGYGRSTDSLTIGQDNKTVVAERRELLGLLWSDEETQHTTHTDGVLLAKHDRRVHKPNRLKHIREALYKKVVVPPVIELGEIVVENKHQKVDNIVSNR